MSSRVLHITLLGHKDLFKGDFRVLSHRINTCYSSSSFQCDLLSIQLTLTKHCLAINSRPPIFPSTHCEFTLFLSVFHLFQYLPRALLRFLAKPYPLQTLLSLLSLYAIQGNQNLLNLVNAYDSFHLYHLRSYWLSYLIPSNKNLVFDLIDSYTLNLSRRLEHSRLSPKHLLLSLELKLVTLIESSLFLPCRSLLCTVSPVDMAYIKPSSSTNARLHLSPQGFHSSPYVPVPPINGPLKLIFFGNLSYHPNRQAVVYLSQFLKYSSSFSPLNISLTVAGRDIPLSLRSICDHSNIDVVSPVSDMKELVQSHHLSIAPLFDGSGLQSKVVESLIWSRPVLLTYNPFSALIDPDPRDFFLFNSFESLSELIRLIRLSPDQLSVKSQALHRYAHQTYANRNCIDLISSFLLASNACL